jgi:hypothetical protein
VEQADQRVKVLEEKIAEQIELVAEQICQGRPALAAMQVLNALTAYLVACEHPLSDTGWSSSVPRDAKVPTISGTGHSDGRAAA